MSLFAEMTKIVPPSAQGVARVEHFEVSERDSRMTSFRPRDFVAAGKYARLYVGQSLMMSDTHFEHRSNYGVVNQAHGDVLIAGLGLGMIVVPILAKREVKSVLVVEKFADVIGLVEPALRKLPGGEKLTTLEADALEWKPPAKQKWDTIYFDIWPDVCTDNLEQIAMLHHRFASRKRPGGWMDSWMADTLRHRRREEKRSGW